MEVVAATIAANQEARSQRWFDLIDCLINAIAMRDFIPSSTAEVRDSGQSCISNNSIARKKKYVHINQRDAPVKSFVSYTAVVTVQS